MKATKFSVGIGIALFVLSTCVTGAPLRKDERIVRDPVTGDYTAYYWDNDEQDVDMVESVLITATKIDPVIRSTLKLIDGWNVRYAYTVRNDGRAKQPIMDIDFYGMPQYVRISNSAVIPPTASSNSIEIFSSALSVPNAKWTGSGARTKKGLNIGWSHNNWSYARNDFDPSLGLRPNETLGGFAYVSPDLPGILAAQLLGNTQSHQFQSSYAHPDWKVTDIARQMELILANDFVARNVAAPMISVPTPFVAATVVDNLRAHVATWSGKQLVEVVFAGQLDRYLVAAADAFRRNQAKAGKEHLEKVRELLKQASPHFEREDEGEQDERKTRVTPAPLIDKLAARVLDFDVQYVLQRSEAREDKNKN